MTGRTPHFLKGTSVRIKGIHPPIYGEVAWDYNEYLVSIVVKHEHNKMGIVLQVDPKDLMVVPKEERVTTQEEAPQEKDSEPEAEETPIITGFDSVVDDFRAMVVKSGYSLGTMPHWTVSSDSGTLTLHLSYARRREAGFFQ